MAIGGYAELKARGIRIGETMSVIGFDDSPSSVNMDPPLTTVNINSCELGFRAVYAAVRLAQTGNMKSEALDSRLINRVSCCCHLCTESDLMKDGRHLLDLDIPDIIDILDGRLFGEIADSFYASKVMSAYNRILIDIVSVIKSDIDTEYPQNKIIDELKCILESDLTDFILSRKQHTCSVNWLPSSQAVNCLQPRVSSSTDLTRP